MKIVHDFISHHGGGENLIISISEMFGSQVITAFNTRKKYPFIKESYLSPILKKNIWLVFLYYFFIFRMNTKETIIFSGNHCCFSIRRCKAKKKIFYAHSLPKSLYSNLYLDHNTNFLIKFFGLEYCKEIIFKNTLLASIQIISPNIKIVEAKIK